MNRPLLEVADIIRSAGEAFLERSQGWINWQHRKVLEAILCCRTAALGGHRDRCVACGHVAISYNSCGKSPSRSRDRLLQRAPHLGSTAALPPHVHCILAAGGLTPDHDRGISSSCRFFLPIKVLSRVFRGKFIAGLKAAFQAGDLHFHGSLLHLAQARAFAAWLRTLFRHDWVVYAKRPFGGPEHALRYLGAYTHRVAISNHRLVTSTMATSPSDGAIPHMATGRSR